MFVDVDVEILNLNFDKLIAWLRDLEPGRRDAVASLRIWHRPVVQERNERDLPRLKMFFFDYPDFLDGPALIECINPEWQARNLRSATHRAIECGRRLRRDGY